MAVRVYTVAIDKLEVRLALSTGKGECNAVRRKGVASPISKEECWLASQAGVVIGKGLTKVIGH